MPSYTYELTVDGITITAKSYAELMNAASKLGYTREHLSKDYYVSATHGVMKIKDMHPAHLRNAILARYEEWLESLRKVGDTEFLAALEEGPSYLLPLVFELKSKNRRGITSKTPVRR